MISLSLIFPATPPSTRDTAFFSTYMFFCSNFLRLIVIWIMKKILQSFKKLLSFFWRTFLIFSCPKNRDDKVFYFDLWKCVPFDASTLLWAFKWLICLHIMNTFMKLIIKNWFIQLQILQWLYANLKIVKTISRTHCIQ